MLGIFRLFLFDFLYKQYSTQMDTVQDFYMKTAQKNFPIERAIVV